MKDVQEKVWKAVAESAYQKIGDSINQAYLGNECGLYVSIAVQALGMI